LKGQGGKLHASKVAPFSPKKREEILKAHFDQSRVKGGIFQTSLLLHALKVRVKG